ncbi:putative short-chain dehydrogenase/reductase family 42E member 2 [Merluccius polli]|uniref:Short-chain dehydrogenase/reductase family 42E member 2 n=1 Tax=Merluccius polli TaxID=89951 RepID=A0AA47MIF8_MERPO|nr:putative short-chain dehydrogenase/reductase family 42E member 2 [Merluccius polli]
MQIPCAGGAAPLRWCCDADHRTSTPPPPPTPPGPPRAMGRPHRSGTTASPGSKPAAAAHRRRAAGGPAGVGVRGGRAAAASHLAEGASLGGAPPGTPGRVLVTGGGGYFGIRLGAELARRGVEVVLLDVLKPHVDLPEGAVFYQGDIRDYGALYRACEGVECVFHTASYGMSGPEQLRKELVESINVSGTKNVINVCKERGISRLVYTSTINVAFTGHPIEDGDEESRPCVPLHMYLDHYSRTKSIADQMVRAANGSWLKGGGRLRSCVLRSSGIYGPGERRHFHRMMENLRRGLLGFRFGEAQAQMNWVHVDNLVLAHVLAAEALTARRHSVASGQAYFINDGVSVNVFEWLNPLYTMFGYRRPMVHLPVSLVYLIATILEYLHLALRPIAETPLLFTRNEVRNVAVSHTFKIDKARRELGFCPKQHDLVESVEQYVRSQSLTSDPWFPAAPHTFILLLFTLGLSLVLMLLC